MRVLHAFVVLEVFALGCTVPPTPVFHPGLDAERLTRVNLRPEDKVIHSANFLSVQNNLAAGTRARITMYTAEEVHLTLNDGEFVMKPVGKEKFPTDGAGIDAFLDKYFIDRKEGLTLDGMGPADLKDEVMRGTQVIGMTKEQVYTCLGPPLEIDAGAPALPLDRKAILASDHWSYPFQWAVIMPTKMHLYFGDGKLQRVEP
jgi:hypothetical protein